MHGDTKVGLAMAIVLIGLAAALCFPRTPRDDSAALELEDAAALDAEIAHLPVRAYTSAETAPRRKPSSETPMGDLIIPNQPAFAPRDIAADHAHTSVAPVAASADPIPNGLALAESAADRPVLLSTSDDLDAEGHSGEPIVHVIENGDTLSGLAQRYLGSVGRYQEIFEANSDQLASPDALRLGMKLRIPAKSTSGRGD